MRKINNILATSAVFSLLAFSSGAFAADEIGVNSAVKGDVTIQTGEQIARQALVKDPVHLGDEVNSSHKSSLQVLLKDETVFTVGPDCILTIDRFVYDPDKNNNGLSAKVSKGMFRFMSGNISKSGPQSVSIDTPVASMGVRGTIAEGLVGPEAIEKVRNAGLLPAGTEVDTEGATLFVLRGPGRRSKARNRKGEISVSSGGKTVTTRRSGYAIFVPAKGAEPIGPFQLGNDIFQVFNDRLRTEPTGGVSFRPFELDPFMKRDTDAPDDLVVPFIPNDSFDPGGIFDWPSDDDSTVVPDCTPQNPDYPDCLLP